MSKVLILSWHPGENTQLTAGGFVRLFEILKQANKPCIVIDKQPNLYKKANSSPEFEYISYTLPEFNKKNIATTFINRILTVIKLTAKSSNHIRQVDQIYVPFSELPQLTLAGVILKFLYKKPLILCNLNVNTYFFDRIVNRALHAYADKVITISNDLKKSLDKSGIHPTNINGVGFTKHSLIEKSKKKYDLIFIGRHTKEKGIEDLKNIVNSVRKKLKKDICCITIGDILDSKKMLEESQIYCLGNVTEAEKNKYITQSRVMVFPSVQEGWGIAPMEALSQAVPVIAYDLPIYKESIGETEAFITVSIKNIDEFSDKLIDVLNKLSYYQAHAKNWKPSMSWKNISQNEFKIICQT